MPRDSASDTIRVTSSLAHAVAAPLGANRDRPQQCVVAANLEAGHADEFARVSIAARRRESSSNPLRATRHSRGRQTRLRRAVLDRRQIVIRRAANRAPHVSWSSSWIVLSPSGTAVGSHPHSLCVRARLRQLGHGAVGLSRAAVPGFVARTNPLMIFPSTCSASPTSSPCR